MDERVAFFRIAVGADEAWSAPRQSAAGADVAAARVSAPKPPAAARSAAPRVSVPKPVAVAAKAGRSAGNGRAKDAAVAGGGPVARMQAAIAEAMIDPEWKEF
jgi:hypothetical protein